MPVCAVYGCRNGSQKKIEGIKFFTFPKDEELNKKWKAACFRADNFSTKHATICSIHFAESDRQIKLINAMLGYLPKKERTLKENAVPTLFLPNKMPFRYKQRKGKRQPSQELFKINTPNPVQPSTTPVSHSAIDSQNSSFVSPNSNNVLESIEVETVFPDGTSAEESSSPTALSDCESIEEIMPDVNDSRQSTLVAIQLNEWEAIQKRLQQLEYLKEKYIQSKLENKKLQAEMKDMKAAHASKVRELEKLNSSLHDKNDTLKELFLNLKKAKVVIKCTKGNRKS